MGVVELEGRTYRGELPVEQGNVGFFVEATGDDVQRWLDHAPPSYAAVALFAVAPSFLWDPEAGEHSRILIHADQRFRFHQPWTVGEPVVVNAQVEKIRMRGEIAWVTFTASASRRDGSTVLDSTSLFLMSADEPPSDAEPQPEPDPFRKADDERPTDLVLPGEGEALAALSKSASRADLVRYAAASGDFNPLHWDHAVARAAGLPRVVCHGLLSASWAMQQAARYGAGNMPVTEARFRFRQPLLAGDPAVVRGSVESHRGNTARLGITVETDGQALVDATAEVRV